MKICSVCQRQFSDDVIYCLQDGTPLFSNPPYNSEEFTVFRPKKATRTYTVIYSLIGIILILIVAFVGIFFWKQSEARDEKSQTNSSASPNDNDLKKKELDLREKELEMEKQKLENPQKTQPPIPKATPPPSSEKPLPPVQSPNAGRTKYSGSIGSSNVVFNLNWNKNKTVTGSYYFTGNPSQSYTLSGTNYTDGEIELQEYGNMNARIKMYKSIKGNTLCWNGNYYATNGVSTISFCRYR